MMRTVGSAECLLMAAAQTVRFLEMTAHWSGASAPTASTCTASSNGSTPSRSSSSAPCVGRSGSSKNELIRRTSLECLSKTDASQSEDSSVSGIHMLLFFVVHFQRLCFFLRLSSFVLCGGVCE